MNPSGMLLTLQSPWQQVERNLSHHRAFPSCGLVRGASVRRFYFGLDGGQRVHDPHGCAYPDPHAAFRAAQRLACEIAELRPELRGNTCIIVTERDRPGDLYCVPVAP
jgi:hypothetical protein